MSLLILFTSEEEVLPEVEAATHYFPLKWKKKEKRINYSWWYKPRYLFPFKTWNLKRWEYWRATITRPSFQSLYFSKKPQPIPTGIEREAILALNNRMIGTFLPKKGTYAKR